MRKHKSANNPAEKSIDNQMKGRVVLVTGGSSGIGLATAFAFAQEGVKVAIASRTPETGLAAVQSIKSQGHEAIWIKADVSQARQVEEMVRNVVDTYGRLDYAFNNGGSGGRGGQFLDLNEEDWEKTINGFLKSVWLCMKYEIPEMIKTGSGAIVNNSSVDGKRAYAGDPFYSAAKHGVLGLTKSVAMEYANKGIRINAICPAWIKTPPVDDMFAKDPNIEKMAMLHQPIGRLGRPEEIAQAVLWLLSDKASFMVGTELAIDGGYLMV
jgi:NAD(P)-dependent dehydrogenase (short-subunit alcohol dehydrogenase family)